MDKRLKCVLILPLKEMALRRVAVLLSSDSIIPFSYDAEWHNTHEERVKYKITKLQLPELLRKEMIDIVRPISLEVRKWRACIHEWLEFSVDIGVEKLYWTTTGTIDYKKTAQALLGFKVLDVATRYKLASVYCLEDSIPLLWEELDEDIKKCFRRKTKDLSYMEVCWPRIIKGDFSYLNRLCRTSDRNLTSFNQWAFERSAREGHKVAAEYFFRKMTHEEREVSLVRTAQDVLSEPPFGFNSWFFPDICRFLLSLMTPEQQMQTIKDHPVRVLWCFSAMLWQDLLFENASLIWHFLPTSAYGEVSENINIIVKMSNRFHEKSFREFFLTSPADFKKYFVHHNVPDHESLISGKVCTLAYSFLVVFILKNDSESIECIFRNIDAADRAAIAFNPDVLEFFSKQRKEDRRHMVKVCLREAKLSKEDRERMKKVNPYFRRVIDELYESHATSDKSKKGRKHKLENYSSE